MANERLFQILTEMRAMHDQDDHARGDQLLCETITLLASALHGEAETVARQIVEAYTADTFPKWYE